jgi:hypothetical protein
MPKKVAKQKKIGLIADNKKTTTTSAGGSQQA